MLLEITSYFSMIFVLDEEDLEGVLNKTLCDRICQ
jgi:hypothetical protein